MRSLIAGALALTLLAAACTQASEAPDPSVLESRSAAFEERFAAGDGAAIAEMYATDAVVMPAGAPQVRGSDSIRQFWQDFIDSGAARLDLTTDEAAAVGPDTIIERGRFAIQDRSGASLGEGKFVVVWRREAGEWKLLWDIWNADAPEQAVQPQ